MKTKSLSLSVIFLASCCWWGCTTQDSITSFTPHYLVEELGVWDFTAGYASEAALDLVDVMDFDFPYDALETLAKIFPDGYDRPIRGVSISYRTIDPFGNPVIATGAFFYPRDLKPGGVVEVPPIALMHDTEAPSLYVEQKKFSYESVPCMLGYITINPDFLGVRYTEDWPRPYLIAGNAGMAAYHMRKAVEEYLLLTENYRLGNRSIILGYSLGASTSLAMAWYYQDNPTGVTVDKVITGGGMYDGLEALRTYARTKRNDYLSIPMVIMGLDKYYNLGLDYSRIFTNGMENQVDSPDPEAGGDGYVWWFSGKRTLASIVRRWGSNLRTYMHPDFFNPELTGEFAKLREPLLENSIVYNFTPGPLTEIHLIHSADDNFIPVECADLLFREYKKKGCAITYDRITGDHFHASFYFIASSMYYLILNN
ncbi:MAG TPA: hypothetical protein PLO22_08150 [Bacteroidales bacterium]|nr:hypothetical protein [Bacteroidales bacterium]HQM58484.1 hypothetical protein [Bacteroidales bacterium]